MVSVVTPSAEVCIEAMSSCVILTMSLIGSLFCSPCIRASDWACRPCNGGPSTTRDGGAAAGVE
eukprot:3182570-Amphidinium_carterae.1